MKSRRKVALITGGAGFIGSHLCDLFLGMGYRVICMDSLITGNRINISHHLKCRGFEFVRHNVSTDIKICGRVDYVLHFASPASPIDYIKYPIQTLRAGSIGTHNAVGLARSKKARFLLASTSEVYGDPLVNPQPETYWGNVNPIGPRSVYDEAKRFSEAMTMAYHRYYKVDTRIVRIFNTYGERMREDDGRAIPNFINQAIRGDPITIYGSGRQTRSFCYVSDLVGGIYKLLMSDETSPVNIGNPNEMSLLELARATIKLTGSNGGIVYKALPVDDPKVRRPNISKAKRLLKWRPEVCLEEGLLKTIGYFKSLKRPVPCR